MQRIRVDERSNWRMLAEQSGFLFHSIGGEPYWDETAYYAFSLREIEDDLEAPSAALEAMCIELVGCAVADEQVMKRLAIPERFWSFIAASWKRRDASLYGRFDLRYDGSGPAKLLEYNADTPTSVFETAVFQWGWLDDAMARRSCRATPISSTRCMSGWWRRGGHCCRRPPYRERRHNMRRHRVA
jgi:glutathionylspermidine synthase